MQSDDKPVNGQPTPSFLDLLNQRPPTKNTDLSKDTDTTRLAQLRAGWNASWEQGGFLHGRWEELRLAPKAGMHGMARWIKALLMLAGVCALLILLDTAGDIFGAALSRLADSVPATRAGTSAVGELWGVVDTPIRSYIDQHSMGLSVSGSAVYTAWQLVGWFGLIGGFLGSTGARITWTCWGAGSVLAVWSAAPADGRTVATSIAVLAWTLASTLALRGWSLRPIVNNYLPPHPAFQPQIEIRPEIHLPAPAPAPDGDTPDNVHQLQR
ncbi:hypothetical protein [Streptomyces candidus]|uniref:Uncharacterized protein n=1 Tax=Streptomyces candidus TaxID=67283 RepID=A0A7X0HK09_9ACTN|nr:hypothetical protein [Streptomyces candidus]MBB6439086.1 hypothetical protein [Streptomyces candidus]GHH55585.1 hypothetical protein GCM10018773_60270 [Streptomyces candidus]